jgi:DNA polymerase-3 subunit alpha
MPDKNELTLIENLIRYGNLIQNERNMAQQSLFGGAQQISIQKPRPIPGDEWPAIVKLEHEKNLVGIYLTAHPLDEYKLEIDSFCTKGVSMAMLDADIASFKGRDLILAGMVTEAYEGMNKKGNRYANLTLTDYNGQLKIFFFGNDYISFGKYCQKGLFLMVRGKVLPRFRANDGAPEMLEFKVQSIELLQEVRNTKVKTLSIEVDLQLITENFIAEFSQICEKRKGQTQLEFKISDMETKTSIHLFSRNIKIQPDDGFIDYLNSKEGIIFKIN